VPGSRLPRLGLHPTRTAYTGAPRKAGPLARRTAAAPAGPRFVSMPIRTMEGTIRSTPESLFLMFAAQHGS